MQPVGADNQFYLARSGMIETDLHAVALIPDPRHGVSRNRFDPSVQRLVDRRRQVGSPQLDVAAIGHAVENIDREAAAPAAMPVLIAHLLHLVTQLSDSGSNPIFSAMS